MDNQLPTIPAINTNKLTLGELNLDATCVDTSIPYDSINATGIPNHKLITEWKLVNRNEGHSTLIAITPDRVVGDTSRKLRKLSEMGTLPANTGLFTHFNNALYSQLTPLMRRNILNSGSKIALPSLSQSEVFKYTKELPDNQEWREFALLVKSKYDEEIDKELAKGIKAGLTEDGEWEGPSYLGSSDSEIREEVWTHLRYEVVDNPFAEYEIQDFWTRERTKEAQLSIAGSNNGAYAVSHTTSQRILICIELPNTTPVYRIDSYNNDSTYNLYIPYNKEREYDRRTYNGHY